MRPGPECGICTFHWVYERTAPYIPEARRAALAEDLSHCLFRQLTADANVGAVCNRALAAAGSLVGAAQAFYDPFKERSNRRARELLPAASKYVDGGRTDRERFERACALAAAANVAPLGAPADDFSFPEAAEIMEGRRQAGFVGDVHRAATAARRIVYVADNAGEIGFDSLVIRMLKDFGAHVTLVVKQEPLFEDATREDASFFGLERLADQVLSSKTFLVPGESTPEVARALSEAHLLFSKGTGAYEALRGESDLPAAFLLKVKCRAIARETSVEEGKVVVLFDSGSNRDAGSA